MYHFVCALTVLRGVFKMKLVGEKLGLQGTQVFASTTAACLARWDTTRKAQQGPTSS
jgi:hypothetical protein